MNEVFDHTFCLRLAVIDLEVIEACLAWPNPPWEGIALHSQQAAEKYLKAFLAFKGELPALAQLERLNAALSTLLACAFRSRGRLPASYGTRAMKNFIEDAEETATAANAAADRICNRIKELL
jgi:HEPN domain-containing protein